ncbi:MAG: nucleoside triphosphate pyrophosphohydrolase [Candidatus Dadabacteria bacterium]|nr:nucleoside triphosphate pyrophosphohydrolase [Candidatus Dadabacteria bacterium]NIS07180.1 nucleoside triphosphate pyrophosphohydrolase [Candidatus Dadabacteria bacterium]NIV41224.1 nucleoside triphosphate pyrophosphohydrolase [Candidatus Dadabacteria bacterium]NIX14309.1 nucleoside triphosphate pyrophosphohydrolase [Candidatus Dadabacteria bacterium]NIY20958.1 nucleoside triphosphate pyrophosphohydrolase [Candidatus Dadabacteria bacterium]
MSKKFDDLVELSTYLRGPEGCPWDKEQDLQKLKSYIIEEAYEVVSAIESGDTDEITEELGDLMFQVIFAAQIASEERKFDIDVIINKLYEKLIRRHPHVFGENKAKNAQEAVKSWQAQKLKEKKRKRILLEIPRGMPALLRAQRVGEKASNVGFDWQNPEDVLDKVQEELAELKVEIKKGKGNGNKDAIEQEWGDLVFSMANLGRHLRIDVESSAHKAVNKFISRFAKVEDRAKEQGRQLSELSLLEMDSIWDEIKSK